MNLNTVRVFVRDLRAARTFYGTTLGLALNASDLEQGYCVFNAGSVELVVERSDDPALVGRFTGLSFLVPDVWRMFDDLMAKGVVFSGRPQVQSWGGTLATFKDLEGNALQIVQRPRKT